jgi:hypothetical protein
MKRNDQLLDRLEDSINRLKLDYDIFFNGGSDHFPAQTHDALNLEIKRFYNNQSLTYAQGFRLNSLATRLSVYNDLWQRNLRMLEQGRKPTYGIRPEPQAARRVEVPIASEADRESIDHLFQAFVRARERAGNDAPIDPLKFEQFIATKLREAKERKSVSEVVFIVAMEDGEVHLKTRGVK